jgi:hypothetical protein
MPRGALDGGNDPNAWYLTTNLLVSQLLYFTHTDGPLADEAETAQRHVEHKQGVYSDANAIPHHA